MTQIYKKRCTGLMARGEIQWCGIELVSRYFMAYGVALNQIPNLTVFDSSLVFRNQIRNMNNGKSFPPSSWIEIDAEGGPELKRATPTRRLLSQRGPLGPAALGDRTVVRVG